MPQFHNTSFILSCLIDARCVKVHAFCNGMYQKVEEKGTSTNVQGKSKDHYVLMANTFVVALTLLILLPKFTFNLVKVLTSFNCEIGSMQAQLQITTSCEWQSDLLKQDQCKLHLMNIDVTMMHVKCGCNSNGKIYFENGSYQFSY